MFLYGNSDALGLVSVPCREVFVLTHEFDVRGVDMYIWHRFRINYVFIFEFNQRQHIGHQHMFLVRICCVLVCSVGNDAQQGAAVFSMLWSFLFLLYAGILEPPTLFRWLLAIDVRWIPLAMFVIFLVIFTIYSFKSDHWLLRTLLRVITTPLTKVTFRDFYLGDQLSSLSISLMDFEFFVCYYTTDALSGTGTCLHINSWIRPLIAMLPAYWRFVQVGCVSCSAEGGAGVEVRTQ
jgi:hypothetical protein